jgi:hypothetical protein
MQVLTGYRLEHPRGLEVAKFLQILKQPRLLAENLLMRMEMLEATPSAAPKVPARGIHTVWRPGRQCLDDTH